jgi:hypothetical protein
VTSFSIAESSKHDSYDSNNASNDSTTMADNCLLCKVRNLPSHEEAKHTMTSDRMGCPVVEGIMEVDVEKDMVEDVEEGGVFITA